MTVTGLMVIVEGLLMLGLILCTAYCSGYIPLVSTSVDKGRSKLTLSISHSP